MPDHREYGAVSLRPRDDPPHGYDDEERYAHEYEPGPGRFVQGLRTFIHRYGWRAYALPVLAVVTVVALVSTTAPSHKAAPKAASPPTSPAHNSPARSAPGTGSGSTELKSDQAGANVQNEALASDVLPKGGPYTKQGDGTFRVLPGTTPVVGSGPLHKYTIDVENGVTGVDLNAFASLVDKVLDDPKSWTHSGLALQRVDSGPADFHVTLTSSMTVRNLCGYELQIETSCYAPDKDSRVVENVARWVRGDQAYIGDLNAYHIYMINHENGHALGHIHSHQCLSNGLAPVMMQQTIGLKSVTGEICQANPWPFPPGATNAPGVEAPDTPQNSPRLPN
ncbi:MAG TPA: DUF3152 domain-containing protein [Jatrophihabitantaceae bacterium]